MLCSVTMKLHRLLVSIFLWMTVTDLCRSQEGRFAGPFRVVLNQIGKCDESGTNQIYTSSTKISKISKTKYVYSTNVTTEILVDDGLMAEMDIARFGNGGWRPHYIQMDFPQFCSSMKQMVPAFYKVILDVIHTDCPIPPGRYELIDLDLETFKVGSHMPNFPYGKYRADFSAHVNGTMVGCIRYYVDVVPNESAKRKPKKT